jgi:precorrin-2 dehydrogenase
MGAALYPLFLNLQGRPCVVVGGGQVAEAKARDLLAAGARVRVICATVTEIISEWSRVGTLIWEARPYQEGDLENAFLVVSCADAGTNAKVFAESERRNIFCNAGDDVEHCSAYACAVVRRGPLQIAISTAGKSPALAQRLRKELEQRFPPVYGLWVERLGELRRHLFKNESMERETRTAILHKEAGASAFEEFCRARRVQGVRQVPGDSVGNEGSGPTGM